MQKPNLPLIILCVFALSFAGKAQTMNSPVEPNTKLKKGDWFNIEFANKLEDYSTPVDSINYCDPENLLQLVLHCEVTDVSKKKLNLKITMERLFHITDSGEYYDSYFNLEADYISSVLGSGPASIDTNGVHIDPKFELIAEINIESGESEIASFSNRQFYEYIIQRLDLVKFLGPGGILKITNNSRVLKIDFTEVKKMIEVFLNDWSARNYNLPLPTFGNLEVAHFKRYRILDANIPVQPNIELVIETEKFSNNELIEIFEMDHFENIQLPADQQIVSGISVNGKITLKFYIEKQKLLTVKYSGRELDFVVTPEKKTHIKLQKMNDQLIAEYIGEISGDNEFEVILSPDSPFKHSQNDFFYPLYSLVHRDINITSVEFHNLLARETNNCISILNRYKSKMSVNWYKKSLKMIYYYATLQSCKWCTEHHEPMYYQVSQNSRFDYTECKDLTYFTNIQPLYDYYLEPKFYKEFLRQYNLNVTRNPIMVSQVQGFQREKIGFPENYDFTNILYLGYPKYFYLSNILVDMNGYMPPMNDFTVKRYNHFMENCKYPPFLDHVQNAYMTTISTKVGESILNLNLNFIKDKNYRKNNGKFKLIGIYNWEMGNIDINEICDSMISLGNQFDLLNKIETYIVYADNTIDSSGIEFISENPDIPIKLINLSINEFTNDRGVLALPMTSYLNFKNKSFTILDQDNRIISLYTNISELSQLFVDNRKEQNRLRDQRNYSQLIIIILSSLLFFGFLSWFVIRIRTEQIQKRESCPPEGFRVGVNSYPVANEPALYF